MANGLLTIHIWFKHVKTKIKHIPPHSSQSPNLASQNINPFTEPSVYTSIHEKI